MTDIVTYCDVNTCEDCPRYGDDCDGDKRVERTDYISRADAIEAVRKKLQEWGSYAFEDYRRGLYEAQDILEALPSADTVPQMEHDREWIIGCIKHDGFIKTDRFDEANQIIYDALSAKAEWIPCSERLPKEEEKTYWVCTDAECQCECRWTNNRFGMGEGEWGWSIFDTPQYTKPIAWMPLPKPYREDGEE